MKREHNLETHNSVPIQNLFVKNRLGNMGTTPDASRLVYHSQAVKATQKTPETTKKQIMMAESQANRALPCSSAVHCIGLSLKLPTAASPIQYCKCVTVFILDNVCAISIMKSSASCF